VANKLQPIVRFITKHFTLDEIASELCLALDVDPDEIPGNNLSTKVRGLVGYAERRGLIDELVGALEAERPKPFAEAGLRSEKPKEAQPAAKVDKPWQLLPRPEAFTGREAELARLMDDLRPGKIAALCGPGGMGKTALAAEALHRLSESGELAARFPDGVITHDFYTRPQALAALEHIALSFGQEARPSPVEAARRVLAGRRVLLMLDGAEDADDLSLVLSARGSQCSVLITSRKREDAPTVEGRQDISPLPTDKSVKLLQEWGQRWAADTRAVQQICELVGGLPLAVCLAGRYIGQHEEEAADYLLWLQESPLVALDMGSRQKESVPLLLDKSLARLNLIAKQVVMVAGLLALAPFGRAAAVAGLSLDDRRVSRALGELVNHGLMMRLEEADGTKPYQVTHPLIYTYAKERLAAPRQVVVRLGRYFTELAENQSKAGLVGYKRLDKERPHIIALLERLMDGKEWAAGRRLVREIDDYLDIQGHWTIRGTVLEYGIHATQASGNRREEGGLITNLGQVNKAIELYEQALVIAREIGDPRGEAANLNNLGMAYADLEQTKQAIEFYEKALAIAREIGSRQDEGANLGNMGLAYTDLGQVERAIEYLQQALQIDREINSRRGEGIRLSNLGVAYKELEQVEQAIGFFEQSLVIAREVGNRSLEGTNLTNLGLAYCELEQPGQAIGFLQQALSIAQEIGELRLQETTLNILGLAYYKLEEVKQAIEFYQQALMIGQEIGDRRGEGIALHNLGDAFAKVDQISTAKAYYEQALVIFEDIKALNAEETRQALARLESN
jgi:tetratricopeptide (TPR) repeat protein